MLLLQIREMELCLWPEMRFVFFLFVCLFLFVKHDKKHKKKKYPTQTKIQGIVFFGKTKLGIKFKKKKGLDF